MKKGTKSTGSTSQLIRDFAEKNPTLKPAEIIKELTAQGHKVYPALVSQALRGTGKTKTRTRKRRVKKAGRKKAAVASASSPMELNVAVLKAAADLIRQSGSAENAIQSIRQYQKISSIFG